MDATRTHPTDVGWEKQAWLLVLARLPKDRLAVPEELGADETKCSLRRGMLLVSDLHPNKQTIGAYHNMTARLPLVLGHGRC